MPLRVNNISKRFSQQFGSVEALRDVSFSMRDGEFVCLVGPSGCGKSTLLSVIAGLEKASSGTIVSSGKVGYIFQDPTLFPWLDVWDNVAFSLKMNGASHEYIRQHVQEYLRLVRLTGFAHAYPHQLSGGMKQRVALIRALIRKPNILLLDEPFGSVDAMTREALYLDIQKIWKVTKTTTLFVTHNVREAVCLGDRVLVMSPRPGRIIQEIHISLKRPRDIGDLRVIARSHTVRKALGANAYEQTDTK
jgi:NitT/TauT family transport system ATP-binding protein